MCVYVWECGCEVKVSAEARGIRLPRAGVIGGCKLPDMDTRF